MYRQITVFVFIHIVFIGLAYAHGVIAGAGLSASDGSVDVGPVCAGYATFTPDREIGLRNRIEQVVVANRDLANSSPEASSAFQRCDTSASQRKDTAR